MIPLPLKPPPHTGCPKSVLNFKDNLHGKEILTNGAGFLIRIPIRDTDQNSKKNKPSLDKKKK